LHLLVPTFTLGGVGGAIRPLREMEIQRNSRATPQGLDQRSKMEDVVPKMACWRGSDGTIQKEDND